MTFNEIYQKYHVDIRNYAISFTKNEADADDVVQDIFIKVFKKLNTVSDFSRVYFWLMTTTRRTCLNFLKDKKMTFCELQEYDGIIKLKKELEADELKSVINSLPVGYRTIVNLRVEGYRHSEISQMLDIGVATSKTQFFKAKRLLQKKLEK